MMPAMTPIGEPTAVMRFCSSTQSTPIVRIGHRGGDEARVVLVLDDLVLVDAVTGLVDGQPRQFLAPPPCRSGHRAHDRDRRPPASRPGTPRRRGARRALWRGPRPARQDRGRHRRTRMPPRLSHTRAVRVSLELAEMPSTSSCGRGMTCTETTSPTLPAAAAPASVAALTAPTSPRTMTVTRPPPICSRPISRTLAALTIALAASIAADETLGLDQPEGATAKIGHSILSVRLMSYPPGFSAW